MSAQTTFPIVVDGDTDDGDETALPTSPLSVSSQTTL